MIEASKIILLGINASFELWIISERVDLNEGFPVKVNGISTVPEEQVSKAE